MQFNMFVEVFLTLWVGIMLIGLLSVARMVVNEDGFWIAISVIVGTTVFFVLVAILAFRYEVHKAKALLEDLLRLSRAF